MEIQEDYKCNHSSHGCHMEAYLPEEIYYQAYDHGYYRSP